MPSPVIETFIVVIEDNFRVIGCYNFNFQFSFFQVDLKVRTNVGLFSHISTIDLQQHSLCLRKHGKIKVHRLHTS